MEPIFKGVDCFLLKVADLEEGLKFYAGKLGLTLLWKTRTAAGLRMAKPGTELVLSTETGPETDLLVENTRAAYELLLASGARSLAAPFEIQVGLCAVVEDPWGNALTILDLSKGTVKTDKRGNVTGNNPAGK
jgi:catechol 2,3-dioxygenase-like lactoylglutathione lyase family enzyme